MRGSFQPDWAAGKDINSKKTPLLHFSRRIQKAVIISLSPRTPCTLVLLHEFSIKDRGVLLAGGWEAVLWSYRVPRGGESTRFITSWEDVDLLDMLRRATPVASLGVAFLCQWAWMHEEVVCKEMKPTYTSTFPCCPVSQPGKQIK